MAQYRTTLKLFLAYLGQAFPDVREPSQLRRDPHLLGWLEYLWNRKHSHSGQPIGKHTRGEYVLKLRTLLDLLCDHRHPPRPGLLLPADVPRRDEVLPRPLAPEDDARLEAELRPRNDVCSNALRLLRATGMRIGECADLGLDCLRHVGDNRWALHVPLGKLRSERWVPVDEPARILVARLAFLRTLPPGADEPFLLPRPKGRAALCQDLRAALRTAAETAGIVHRIVPHQLRHTYATDLLRRGVSLPALMKLLGHKTANMTLRYVEVTQQDLQREFAAARLQPRHRLSLPSQLAPPDSIGPSADRVALLAALDTAIRITDLHRQQNAPATQDATLRRMRRRLTRIRSAFEKLAAAG